MPMNSAKMELELRFIQSRYRHLYETVGYVVNVTSHEGYGGDIDISVGIREDGTVTGIEMLSISETAGLGMKAKEAYVGIVRSNTRLIRAWNRLDILYEETESLFKRCKASRELCELRNMINVGYLITRQAMERKESRGLHYTIDYPPVK